MAEPRPEAALERAIEAAPDDPQAYAVYGDWLSQQGDLRGELIALHLLPSLDRRQRERVKALLYERGIRCLAGPLAQWRWGFVHTATLVRPPAGTSGARVDLARLLRHPSMRFVRALTLGQEPIATSLGELSAAAPSVLASLTIYSPRALELSLVPASLPALEQLHLSLPEITGALPPLPRLRALELSFLEWTTTSAAQLFEANRQHLTRLRLAVSEEVAPGPLLEALALPALEHLVIEASAMGVDAVAALEDSPGAERLVTLDLSRSGLSERAAKRVLQLSRRLPRLSSLVLGDAVES